MLNAQLAISTVQLIWMAALFTDIQGKIYISVGGKIRGDAAENIGGRMTLMCATMFNELGREYAESDHSIWFNRFVSLTDRRPSALWSLVYRNFNGKTFISDPRRMTELPTVRIGDAYVRTTMVIEALDPYDDSGLYKCNGTYLTGPGGRRISLESEIVKLAITSGDIVKTWMKINKTVYAYQPSNKTTSIRCFSYHYSTSTKIIEQQIYKYQSFPMKLLSLEAEGSSTRLWTLIYNSSYQRSLSDLTWLEPKGISTNYMTSGINIDGSKVQHTGQYFCRTIFQIQSKRDFDDSLPVALDSNGPLRVSLLAFGNNGSGVPSTLTQQAGRLNSAIYSSDVQTITINCTMVAFNEIPYFKLMIDDVDVTSAANTSGSYSQLLNFNKVSNGFSAMRYVTVATYSGKTIDICKYQVVTCISWRRSHVDSTEKRRKFLARDLCRKLRRRGRVGSAGPSKVKTKTKAAIKEIPRTRKLQ